jgi:histone-lysine N-methyltransferase SETDB1
LLRNLEEVHRYLRITKSTLEIDYFNMEWFVKVFDEWSPQSYFNKITDLSYGKENYPVPSINSIDKSYPEHVEYSTVR